ncbi:MAG: sarcosine oxidase subunit gamma family protein [Marinobacter sp.]|nr:sarcosine oxidase subunit gamma family protein [Marinobacter sp.]
MSEAINKAVLVSTQVAIMDQLPETGIPARSPLSQHVKTASRTSPENPGVYLWESALKTHLALRGDANNADFAKGVEAATGLVLPEAMRSNHNSDWALSWIAPDEWLLTGPGDQALAMETALREQLDGHYAVINVGGGQTLVRLAGARARSVLMKSCPYDVHDHNFPVGKVVTTVLAKSQATIRRVGDDDWELVVRRSFADYIWRWLVDASQEYRLSLNPPPKSASTNRSSRTEASPVEN